jgi:hypothetical protein
MRAISARSTRTGSRMNQQAMRHAARRSALDAEAIRREEWAHHERRAAMEFVTSWECGRSKPPRKPRTSPFTGVSGIAGLHVVVEDVVVNNMGFVAELDRLAEPTLRDRPAVEVMQADPRGRPVRGDPNQPLPSLGRDPSGCLQQLLKIVNSAGQATRRRPVAGSGRPSVFPSLPTAQLPTAGLSFRHRALDRRRSVVLR